MTDPTRVVGRRCAAFAIDGITVVVVIWIAAQATRDVVDVRGACPDPVPAGRACVEWSGDAYLISGRAFVWFVVTLVALLVVVMGFVRWRFGASLGKVLLGIRVVDAHGSRPGFWRGALRTAALGVDAIAVLLPIGLWLALLTPRHRRVGDFLAGTFVVRRDAVGAPVP
ncbi:MAG TPA: RDD family protein [Acidimicrobiia bacterium]